MATNPLPIAWTHPTMGDEVSGLVGWGKDSHGFDHPALEYWGVALQIARPFWFAGGFDEYGEFRFQVWYDNDREGQAYRGDVHKNSFYRIVKIGEDEFSGVFVECDFRPLERRPSWAYDHKVIVDGEVCDSWDSFQRSGLFEAWEVGISCIGTQMLQYPYAGIIPYLPSIPGIIIGGLSGAGGGQTPNQDNEILRSILLRVLNERADRQRRKRHEREE